MTIHQTASPVEVFSTLGDGIFGLSSAVWSESLGTSFEAELHLVSDEPEIDLNALIKQPMSIQLQANSDAGVTLNGLVSRFESVGVDGGILFVLRETDLVFWSPKPFRRMSNFSRDVDFRHHQEDFRFTRFEWPA